MMLRNKILMLRRLKRNRKAITAVCIAIVCAILGYIGFAYYITYGGVSGVGSIGEVLIFKPIVNGSDGMNQNIDLSYTMTSTGNLAPGSIGKFKIDVDFTEIKSDAYYKISFDRTGIPNNLHFYVDDGLTNELSYIEGVKLYSDTNNNVEHYIYWSWLYSDDSASNANDSLYMDQEISVPFTVYISQHIDNHTIIVNGYEKPTGVFAVSSQEGSYTFNLDFSNISSATNYHIYFEKEFASDTSFYSDSSYQNEITSLYGYYDGTNTNITQSVYWRCTGTCSDNIYYIVDLS